MRLSRQCQTVPYLDLTTKRPRHRASLDSLYKTFVVHPCAPPDLPRKLGPLGDLDASIRCHQAHHAASRAHGPTADARSLG